MSSPLKFLLDVGQSIWLDNLSLRLVSSGELEGLCKEGLRGITSNPSIFKVAIADSSDYDDEINLLIKEGVTTDDEIVEKLCIATVREAAKVLLPVYEESVVGDGCVSLEVSPLLAYDTEGTIAAAKRLWRELSSPNVMIKIPATREGLQAIRACTAEGININVTLIFSTERYREVVDMYLSGLEERVAKGLPISNVYSVASFFVSRIDTLVDSLLKEKTSTSSLIGQVALGNSWYAFKVFNESFSSSRFLSLKNKHGASVQRLLWASTSVKNPEKDPLFYVNNLIAPLTVNTVPPATLKCILKGVSSTELLTPEREHQGKKMLQELSLHGIEFREVAQKLEDAGVELFQDAYRELVGAVASKRSH
jgi:transaldolase